MRNITAMAVFLTLSLSSFCWGGSPFHPGWDGKCAQSNGQAPGCGGNSSSRGNGSSGSYPSAGAQAYNINEEGRAALRARNYDRAIELFERAYATNPEQVFLNNKKLALAGKYASAAHEAWKEEDWDRAIDNYRTAYSFDPDPVYLDNISKAKGNKNNTIANQYNARGRIALRAGNYDSAIELFERAYATDPYQGYLDNKQEALGRKYAAKASAAWAVKDWDGAISNYTTAYSHDPDPVYLDNINKAKNNKKRGIGRKYNEEGKAALKAKDYDKAIKFFDRANDANPDQAYLDNKDLALKGKKRKKDKERIANAGPKSWEKMGKITTEMKAGSGELMRAMDAVSAREDIFWERYSGGAATASLPKGKPEDVKNDLLNNNCQTFFRALGEELAKKDISSWNKSFPLTKNGKSQIGNPDADEIVAKMEEDAGSISWLWGGREWKKLDNWVEAQNMANAGAIVIGGSRRGSGAHGHLSVVVPLPPFIDLLTLGNENEDGPLVRDGNEHSYYDPNNPNRITLTTWGAVRASRAFGRETFKNTNWYMWVPSR